jgi:hypothetical protein
MCQHKFHNDLKLDYITWDVTTLFIGTFNPGCCKEEDNSANWFYGRTQNNMFWDTLGYIYENNPQLGQHGNPQIWKAFCERNEIAVTDMISAVKEVDLNGADYQDLCNGFSDKKLEYYIHNNQIVSTRLEELITNSPKLQNLKYVYLTRATANNPWNTLWNPINQICTKKKIHIKKLTTPGGFNYFQFNAKFLRTPQNLGILWNNNGFENNEE